MHTAALESQQEQLWNRRHDSNVAPVNELCDSLRELRPGSEVPYVDPLHDVDECRIISLFSNTGSADDSGFISAGGDDAAARLLGIQWKVGLHPRYVMPWNVSPWFLPGEMNGKLTTAQVAEGLRPLLKFLALVPRASALVAHGTEAQRLADLLLKTQGDKVYKRGFKVYKVRSLTGRSFAGSAAKQEQWLADMHVAYADAMARAGLSGR